MESRVNVAGSCGAASKGAVTLVIASVVLLLASGCQRQEEQRAPEIRPVRVITVEKRAAGDAVSLTGNVQAETEVNLSFRVDGRMVERNVNIGDTVRPGQLIARLDPQNEESSLQAARAQQSAARAQLAEARNNYTRMRDLVAQNAVSRAQFDQAESVLKTAEAQLEGTQSSIDLATNRLGYTRLTSTVAGVVTAQGAEPGEIVGAGRMVVQVAREGARDAVFDVPPRLKDLAPPNAEIQVFLTADPKVTAPARVREVAPRADPVTGTFRVRMRIVNPPAAMRLGSTVTGRMKLASAPAIEIPTSAVVRADGRASVWVVDPKAATVSARSVELQPAGDPSRVVVNSGLTGGELVVTAGVHALRPGQKVRLLEKQP